MRLLLRDNTLLTAWLSYVDLHILLYLILATIRLHRAQSRLLIGSVYAVQTGFYLECMLID